MRKAVVGYLMVLFVLTVWPKAALGIAPPKTATQLSNTGLPARGLIDAQRENWFQFKVTETGNYYCIDTRPSANASSTNLTDTYMRLYDGQSMALLAQDDNSGDGNFARIYMKLNPGSYYVSIRARTSAQKGSYTIRLVSSPNKTLTFFHVNGGKELTLKEMTFERTVTLDNIVCGMTPVQYKVSENKSFKDAAWKKYDSHPSFTLSAGNESKYVYFKVRDAKGKESEVVQRSIALEECNKLTLGTPVRRLLPDNSSELQSFRIDLKKDGDYSIEIKLELKNSLADLQYYVSLLGCNDQYQRIDGYLQGVENLKLGYHLKAGSYYIGFDIPSSGSPGVPSYYTISVKPFSGAPLVNKLMLNGGDNETLDRVVSLGTAGLGEFKMYMASEAADFKGAVWKPFSSALLYTLSDGEGVKKVYFKVKDSAGRVSNVVSETIYYKPVVALTVGGTPVQDWFDYSECADYYSFTITKSGRYVVAISLLPGVSSYIQYSLFGSDGKVLTPVQSQGSRTKGLSDTYSLAPGNYMIQVPNKSSDDCDEPQHEAYTIQVLTSTN